MKNIETLLATAAKTISKRNVNSACIWFIHQPKIPKKVVEKLKS